MGTCWELYIRDRETRAWHPIWRASGPRAEASTRARFEQIATTFAGGDGAVRIGDSWAAVRLVASDVAVAERERTHWRGRETTLPTMRPPGCREG
jgi:hypothetical protein